MPKVDQCFRVIKGPRRRQLVGRGVKNRARRIHRAGFATMTNHRAFGAKQDSESAESFSRSGHGRLHSGPDRELACPPLMKCCALPSWAKPRRARACLR
jgi:hypothetical protein